MADNRKLAQGLMMMTPAMRKDLAGREQDIQRGKTVELLRRAGKEMYENPIINATLSAAPVTGEAMLANDIRNEWNQGNYGTALGLGVAGLAPYGATIGKGWLAARALEKPIEELSSAALRGITGSASATPIGVIDEIQRMNLLPSATVWHGSPHTFDKFDLSKIGTGEGAQAYGHGLYLAESPKTAEHYKYAGETVKYTPTLEKFTNGPNYYIDESGKYMKARDWVRNDVPVEVPKEEYLQKFNEVQAAHQAQPTGQLYKVDLPDEQIAKMLDYDAPLKEQPYALERIRSKIDDADLLKSFDYNVEKGISGGNAYMNWVMGGKTPAQTSAILNELGVPGIQYLDQASRGAGDGTRNYVVFSDEIPQILERNGQPIGLFGVDK